LSPLELWDEDPEGFAFEEGGDSWRYSWRPCCETVFLSLFHEFRELLAPLLVQMVRYLQKIITTRAQTIRFKFCK
jgi:hypothetical protein